MQKWRELTNDLCATLSYYYFCTVNVTHQQAMWISLKSDKLVRSEDYRATFILKMFFLFLRINKHLFGKQDTEGLFHM